MPQQNQHITSTTKIITKRNKSEKKETNKPVFVVLFACLFEKGKEIRPMSSVNMRVMIRK